MPRMRNSTGGVGTWVLCLAGLALVVAVATGCGEAPTSEVDPQAAAYRAMPLERLLDWEVLAEGGQTALLAALAELERRLPELDEAAVIATVVPALAQAASREEAQVRARAVEVVSAAAAQTEAETALHVLARVAANDEAESVRKRAVDELGRLLPRRMAGSESAVAALAAALTDAEASVRLAALAGLERGGPWAAEATGAVVARTQAQGLPREEVLAAWATLRALQPSGEDALEYLTEVAATAPRQIALQAMQILADLSLGDDLDVALTAVEALVPALIHEDAAVRRAAVAALAEAGAKASGLADEALEHVAEHDPDRAVRRDAQAVLAALGQSTD